MKNKGWNQRRRIQSDEPASTAEKGKHASHMTPEPPDSPATQEDAQQADGALGGFGRCPENMRAARQRKQEMKHDAL